MNNSNLLPYGMLPGMNANAPAGLVPWGSPRMRALSGGQNAPLPGAMPPSLGGLTGSGNQPPGQNAPVPSPGVPPPASNQPPGQNAPITSPGDVPGSGNAPPPTPTPAPGSANADALATDLGGNAPGGNFAGGTPGFSFRGDAPPRMGGDSSPWNRPMPRGNAFGRGGLFMDGFGGGPEWTTNRPGFPNQASRYGYGQPPGMAWAGGSPGFDFRRGGGAQLGQMLRQGLPQKQPMASGGALPPGIAAQNPPPAHMQSFGSGAGPISEQDAFRARYDGNFRTQLEQQYGAQALNQALNNTEAGHSGQGGAIAAREMQFARANGYAQPPQWTWENYKRQGLGDYDANGWRWNEKGIAGRGF